MASSPPDESSRQEFERAIAALKGEIANFAAHASWEPSIRAAYQRNIQRFAEGLRGQATRGEITWKLAAEEAQKGRNVTMEILRSRSTPVGRALAQGEKAVGRSMNELVGHYTLKLFGEKAKFPALSIAQQEKVYAEIVAAAARSNPRWDRFMRFSSRAGRGLIVLSVAISIYTIATAEDKVDAAAHEGAVAAGGILGGIAVGALAGLACGPGAPVCVTVGAFVGGAAVALGVDFAWH